MATKLCSRCKTEKDKSEFNRRVRSKDGLQPYCKACERENNQSRSKLPKRPEKLMGSAMFLVCAALVDGPKSVGKLRHMLENEVEWGATKRSAAYGVLCQFEMKGIVNSIEFDNGKDRIYQLTRKGFVNWAETCKFYEGVLNLVGHLATEHRPEEYPDIKQTARAQRQVISNRYATPEEAEKIIEVAPPDFAQLYKFGLLIARRPTDFANAKIERIDWKQSTLTLEATSISKRTIEDRTVKLDAQSSKFLKSVVGHRTAGLIFMRSDGVPWNGQKVSRDFRTYVRKAGLPEEIVLSGRGGHIASHWEDRGQDDENGESED